jgi:hypothetical protein
MIVFALYVIATNFTSADVGTPPPHRDATPAPSPGQERPSMPMPIAAPPSGRTSDTEADDQRFGPVLYRGPSFDVTMVYDTPTYETTDHTTMVGATTITTSMSIQSGAAAVPRRVTAERIHGRNALEPAYLVGFCHVRNAIRHFRVDRIKALTPAGAAQPVENPSWYLRRLIASGRHERPLVRSNESIVLAQNVGTSVVVHRQRGGSLASTAGLPGQLDELHVDTPATHPETRVEVFEMDVASIVQAGARLCITGKAVRRPSGHSRRWSGHRRFYIDECDMLEAPDGTQITDPIGFLYEAAGIGLGERPLALETAPEPPRETVEPVRPTLRFGDAGTVRVHHRERTLRRQEGTVFYLGREDFEDGVGSPNGRFLTGISQGNMDSDDVVPGVALVDTTTGRALFVLRFGNRPRWSRANDAGLLLVREVSRRDEALLHLFDPSAQRRWSVTLPTAHDVAEFSADGGLVAVISGLFWRRSNAAVWTWLLRADTGTIIDSLNGTDVLRATDNGRCDINATSGTVTILSPPGLLERALAPGYITEWRTRPS